MRKLLCSTLLLSLPVFAGTCPKPTMNASGAFDIIDKGQGNLCEYLDQRLVSKTARNEKCETMFHTAIRKNNSSAINCLESVGYSPRSSIEINIIDQFLKLNHYEFAVSYGPLSSVKQLKSKGGALSPNGRNYYSEFTLAAGTNSVEVIRYLDSRRSDVNDMTAASGGDHKIHSALHRAAKTNSVEAISYLVKRGADVNLRYQSDTTSEYINTPLELAAAYNSKEVVELLIRAGADVSGNGSYYSPLERSLRQGRLGNTETLIQAGADVDRGQTPPILIAAATGDIDLMEKLIRAGADIFTTRGNQNAMAYAVKTGKKDFVEFLLRAGSPLSSGGSKKLIEIAAEANTSVEFIEFLVDQGAPSGSMNEILGAAFITATKYLSSASEKNSRELMKYAIQNGANPNLGGTEYTGYTGGDDSTLLMRAVQLADKDLVSILIKAGAEINAQGSDGMGLYHYAILQNSKLSDQKRVSMINYLSRLGVNKKLRMTGWTYFFADNTGGIQHEKLTAFEVAKELGMSISIQNALK